MRIIGAGSDYANLLYQAQALKERFNREFWVKKQQFYAVALDGKRRAVAAKASNVGHCLDTGIVDEDRIAAVVNTLMGDTLFSGWGIRTLSSDNPGYDPFSYHRGAVWPVENAFIANGLMRMGFHTEANRLITAQMSVTAVFQHMRLPEVLSGHPRTPRTPIPGIYNFGNLLQAWSVSSIAQHLQTMLGIIPRADRGELYLDPHLPDWLQWIELKNLKVGSSVLHLRFWRDTEGLSHWKPLSSSTHLRILPGTPNESFMPHSSCCRGV